MQSITTGTITGAGSFSCEDCGYVVTTGAEQALPACPSCDGERFTPATAFTGRTVAVAGAELVADPRRLDDARELASPSGQFLAYEDDGELQLVPLTKEWTRVGRSLAADVRFDDSTVSRRHAILSREDGRWVLLDDRSANGTWVDGERVTRAVLRDGARLRLGTVAMSFLLVEAAAA